MKELNNPIRLNNKTCPYCGKILDNKNLSKEHTIGRKFVPKGSLENEWNLLINACKDCNNYKSELEDDISAIIQYYSIKKNNNHLEVKHKMENSFSRRTNKKIIASFEKMSIKIISESFQKMDFSLTMPPQVNQNRIEKLAKLHLSAFYYYLTYDEELRIGNTLPDNFICFTIPYKSNWGDKVIQYFLSITTYWKEELKKVTANNNFKCIIKYCIIYECYYWALEWNQSEILMGFFGNKYYINMIINHQPQKNKENGCIEVDENTYMLEESEDYIKYKEIFW